MVDSPFGEPLIDISMADIARAERDIWERMLDAGSDKMTARTPEEYMQATIALNNASHQHTLLHMEAMQELEDEEAEKKRQDAGFWDSLIDAMYEENLELMQLHASIVVEAQMVRKNNGQCVMQSRVDSRYFSNNNAISLNVEKALANHVPISMHDFITLETIITGTAMPTPPTLFLVPAMALAFGHNIDLSSSRASFEEQDCTPEYTMDFDTGTNFDDLHILVQNTNGEQKPRIQVVNSNTGAIALTTSLALAGHLIDLTCEEERTFFVEQTGISVLQDASQLANVTISPEEAKHSATEIGQSLGKATETCDPDAPTHANTPNSTQQSK